MLAEGIIKKTEFDRTRCTPIGSLYGYTLMKEFQALQAEDVKNSTVAKS